MDMSDEEILERWMQRYGAAIQNVCYGQLNDHQLAEDAAQETFWKALCSYKKFRGDASEKTWLTRIAINCCNDIRRKQRRCVFLVGEKRCAENGERELDAVAERAALADAMTQLNEADRRVLQKYYGEGCSVREISEESGVSEAALHQRLSRARKKLKLLLVTLLVILCGLAAAALSATQKNRVNQLELPELDPMQVVSTALEKADGEPETLEYTGYPEAQKALGLSLLDLPNGDASRGTVRARTDGANYALLWVEDFCTAEGQRISLKADLVLSAEQLANLWSTDYLGSYRFVEQTVSEQGYQVDILEETHSETPCRIALFVADGVRYELRGRVSQNVLICLISKLK